MGFTYDNAKELETYGWTVVKNVIAHKMLEDFTTSFNAWFTEACDADYSKLIESHGIINYPEELSHTSFVDAVRNSVEVQNVFRQVHGVCADDEMVSSYDRVNFQLAPSERKTKYRTHHRWWHIDQSSSSTGRQCVQGYVDILGAPSSVHAGLQVISKSHLCFEHLKLYFEDSAWKKNDWFKMTEEELADALGDDWKNYVVDVKSSAGDLVLWDSRTIHMARRNSSTQDGIIGGNSRRLVVYTCAWPALKLSQKQLEKRVQFRKNKWTSSHWPDCRARLRIGQLWGRKLDPKVRTVTNKWLVKYQ